jgi:hypothetical protein
VAKLLGGRICCLVGLLLSAGGILFALLGVLGYFLGARRLGAATVVLGVVAVFFMAAASTGLIPGVTPVGHGYD